MLAFPEGASLSTAAPTMLSLLLDLTLKGVLILVVAGLTTLLLRRASAALRHLVWSLALCALLLVPVLSALLPAWHLTALTEIPYLHTVTDVLANALPETEAAGSVPPDDPHHPPDGASSPTPADRGMSRG